MATTEDTPAGARSASNVLEFRRPASRAGDITAACPFCAEASSLEVYDEEGFDEDDNYGVSYWVGCYRCCAGGPKLETAALAVAAWNHRPKARQ